MGLQSSNLLPVSANQTHAGGSDAVTLRIRSQNDFWSALRGQIISSLFHAPD